MSATSAPSNAPYGTQSGYSLEEAMKELTQEPCWPTVAKPCKFYPISMGETTLIGEESVVKKKTVYFPINSGNGADSRYTGDEKSSTDQDSRATRSIARRRRTTGNPVAENPSRKTTVTRLTRMEAILHMTATICRTKRGSKPPPQKKVPLTGTPTR